ncbi:MAG: HAD family hydrolase [Candidatus Nanoarchaeia archaeon]|nr:HAD family hydrolase [Candidatus Nanoarchaeia archaeon]
MIKAVIFDFDGVLVDSFESVYQFYKQTYRKGNHKFPYKNAEHFKKTYNHNYREYLYNIGMSDKEIDEIAVPEYINFMNNYDIKFKEGMAQVISELSKDKKLAIASTSYTQILKNKLDKYQVLHLFEHLVGGDLVKNKKPHPESLELCLEKLKISPKEAVYIGDMAEDIHAARAAKMKVIAVTYGWHTRKKLEELNPDFIIDKPEEILTIVNNLP